MSQSKYDAFTASPRPLYLYLIILHWKFCRNALNCLIFEFLYVIIILHSVSAVCQILVRSGHRICVYVFGKVYLSRWANTVWTDRLFLFLFLFTRTSIERTFVFVNTYFRTSVLFFIRFVGIVYYELYFYLSKLHTMIMFQNIHYFDTLYYLLV